MITLRTGYAAAAAAAAMAISHIGTAHKPLRDYFTGFAHCALK